MMSPRPWTVEEIVRFRCPAEVAWAPDGSCITYILRGEGEEELGLVNLSGVRRSLPQLASSPTAKMWGGVEPSYAWHPQAKALLRVSEGLWIYDLHTNLQEKLTSGEEPESHPSWAPDGQRFAFRHGDRVGLYDLKTSSAVFFSLPGPVYKFAPHLRWSPNGSFIAVAFRRPGADGKPAKRGLDIAVISLDGRIIWATDTAGTVANPQWVNNEQLLFTRYNETRTVAEHVLIHIPSGVERVLLTEEEPKGFLPDFVEGLGCRGPFLSPGRNEAVIVRPVGGWPHLHLFDLESGALRQVTFGEREDSNPTWSPDGKYIAYISNGGSSWASAEVWVLDKENGESWPLFSLPGAKGELAWSPQKHGRTPPVIAFLHAGPGEPPGLWVVGLNGQSAIRLVSSEGIRSQDFPPQEVWVEALDGHRTPGLLYTRPGVRRRPGIIWLHGGPYMQYYLGWPIDYGYCMYYAFHQLLVQRGYSVLCLNYRGSTGYGVEHEQGNYLGIGTAELADIAGAARFLSSLPQVEGQPLCIAGTSYGGFLTLSAMTRLPGLFHLGVVIAGLGDLAGSLETSGLNFWDDTLYFRWRMGWSAEQNPQGWLGANVLLDLGNLEAPLVIFHGLEDQAVPVEEAYKVEKCCRELGKRCFAHYYAGEDHVFSSKETWRDVFTRILKYLEEFVG